MLGVECASIAARRVRDPGRNVPRATLIGTFIVGLIYLLVSTPVAMLLPQDEVARSNGPIALFVSHYWSPSLGLMVGLFAAVSAIGALNGFVLLQGELPLVMARGGGFPAWFARTSRAGIPVRAQILSSLFATALIAANYSRSLAGLFTFMILLATSATLVLYLTCALAALRLQQTRALRLFGEPRDPRRARRALRGLDALRRRLRGDRLGRGAARHRHGGLRGDAAHRPLQPGGGGESSRVSGMSRLSFLAKLLQADLAPAQRPRRVERRGHALLDAADQRGVLGIDPAVDPPVQIARRLHLAAARRAARS